MKIGVFSLSASYAAMEGLQKGVIFFLTPLFAAYIAPEEYGAVSLVLMLVAIFKIVVSFSLESTVMRYYQRLRRNDLLLSRFLGTILVFIASSYVIYLLGLLLVGETLFDYLLPDLEFYPYVIAALVVSALQQFSYFLFTIFKASQDIKNYAIYYNSYFILQTTLLVFCVVSEYTQGDLSYIYGLLVSNVLSLIFIINKLRTLVALSFDIKLIKIALAYSLSIMPIQLVNIINNSVDRYVVLHYIGPGMVGVYFVGYQMALVVLMVLLAINSAFTPTFFRLYQEGKASNNYDKIYNYVDKIVFVGYVLMVASLFVIPPFFELVFPDSYAQALDVIPALIFSNAIMIVYFINTNALSINAGLNRKKIVGVVSGVCSNVVSSLILVEKYGALGAAIGTVIGYLVSIVYFVYIVGLYTLFEYKNKLYIATFILLFILSQLELVVGGGCLVKITGLVLSVIVLFLYWNRLGLSIYGDK